MIKQALSMLEIKSTVDNEAGPDNDAGDCTVFDFVKISNNCNILFFSLVFRHCSDLFLKLSPHKELSLRGDD